MDKLPLVSVIITTKNEEKMVQDMYKIAFNPEFLIRKILSVRNLDDLKFYWGAGKHVIGHIRDFGGS
ncbi:MAG: hypothetical protein ISS48_00755 [Candidatus Aenigmarchaeota archaeon]|nr:hypothetical protein [Candidatus Aenigmarchaeota archaeon]